MHQIVILVMKNVHLHIVMTVVPARKYKYYVEVKPDGMTSSWQAEDCLYEFVGLKQNKQTNYYFL